MSGLAAELATLAEQRRQMLEEAGPAVSHDRKVLDQEMQHRATLPKVPLGDDRAFLANIDAIARGEMIVE